MVLSAVVVSRTVNSCLRLTHTSCRWCWERGGVGILKRQCLQLKWNGWGVRAWLEGQVRERVVEQCVERGWEAIKMNGWKCI